MRSLSITICFILMTMSIARADELALFRNRAKAIPYRIELKPDFPGAAEAIKLREQKKFAKALAYLNDLEREGPPNDHERLFRAVLLLEAGQPEAAIQGLEGLEQSLPEIADDIRTERAEAYLEADHPEKAVQVLKEVSPTSALKKRATLLAVDSELERGEPRAALKELEGLTEGQALETLSSDVLLAKAKVLQKLGGKENTSEALRHFRAITIHHALSSRKATAESELRRLKKAGWNVPEATPEERFIIAASYLRANLNTEAIKQLKRLWAIRGLTRALNCDISYALSTAYQNKRQYTNAAPFLRAATKLCEEERTVKAYYRMGRGSIRSGKLAKAESPLRTLAKKFPHHSYADDALFMLGRAYQDEGSLARAGALFKEQIKRFPEGDMRGEASWMLAWTLHRQGHRKQAIAQLESALSAGRKQLEEATQGDEGEEGPGEKDAGGQSDGKNSGATGNSSEETTRHEGNHPAEVSADSSEEEGAEGDVEGARSRNIKLPLGAYAVPGMAREVYWRARWMELSASEAKAGAKSGNGARSKTKSKGQEAAVEAYAELLSWAPLDYYGLLAYQRLKTLAPKKAAELSKRATQAMKAPASAEDIKAEEQPQPIRRAVTLLRSGLIDRAVRTLAHHARGYPGADPLLVSYLFEKAGDYRRALFEPKAMVEDMRISAVDADSRLTLLLAYPPAFAEVLQSAADKQKLDPLLLMSLAREESAFDPEIRSWAGAIGLIQLMPSTARWIAKRTKQRRPRNSDLMIPTKNADLGARYLAYLLQKLSNHVGLAIPAYNAGDGAVKRWLRDRGSLPFDEWVEEIPYKQTRDYVRRVLTTYQTYQYLYRSDTPFVPLKLELPK